VTFELQGPAWSKLKKASRTGIMPPMENAPVQERRALVVEDDEDIRALLEYTLQTQGFDVVAVDSGVAGASRPCARRNPT
jgi:PleD family two-component response regulator